MPDNFCNEHRVLTYKVDEILEILHGWSALVRRVVAGLIIAAIISALGFVIAVEVRMSEARADTPQTMEATP